MVKMPDAYSLRHLLVYAEAEDKPAAAAQMISQFQYVAGIVTFGRDFVFRSDISGRRKNKQGYRHKHSCRCKQRNVRGITREQCTNKQERVENSEYSQISFRVSVHLRHSCFFDGLENNGLRF